MDDRQLQGYLTFFGFSISVLAVFYFAIEYIPRVSDWSQLAALGLLGICFAFLGVYLAQTAIGEPFFQGPRMRWLRPAVVLYLMALIAGIAAEIRFLTIDDVIVPVKILVSLFVGVGLIFVAARRRTAGPRDVAPPGES